MAILDAQNTYSDAQALTATAASTNVIDHGADGNLGIGEPMVVVLSLDVASDFGTGDETYVVALEADSTAAFSSAVTVGSVSIVGAQVAGTKFYIPVPPSSTMEQFSRLNYTLAGTTPSVTLTAVLLPQSFVQNDVYYASGFIVS